MIELRTLKHRRAVVVSGTKSGCGQAGPGEMLPEVYRLERMRGIPLPSRLFSGYVVVLVLTGEALFTMGYRNYTGQKGRLFVFHPGCLGGMDLKDSKGWFLRFEEAAYCAFCNHYPELKDRGLFDENLEPVFQDLPGAQEKTLKSQFAELPHSFYRLLKQIVQLSRRAEPVQPAESWTEAKLREFEELLDRFFKQERTTGFYSRKLGLTDRRLNSLVAAKYGKTVRSLILLKVADEVLRMLKETDQEIPLITEELGFCDTSHFYSFCKKTFGAGPIRIRKKF